MYLLSQIVKFSSLAPIALARYVCCRGRAQKPAVRKLVRLKVYKMRQACITNAEFSSWHLWCISDTLHVKNVKFSSLAAYNTFLGMSLPEMDVREPMRLVVSKMRRVFITNVNLPIHVAFWVHFQYVHLKLSNFLRSRLWCSPRMIYF